MAVSQPAGQVFPDPPLYWADDRANELWRLMSLAVRGLLQGKSNNLHDVTLAPNATETMLIEEIITPNSRIFLFPQTASAAAATPYLYAVTGVGEVTIYHDSQPATDRRFHFVHIG